MAQSEQGQGLGQGLGWNLLDQKEEDKSGDIEEIEDTVQDPVVGQGSCYDSVRDNQQ